MGHFTLVLMALIGEETTCLLLLLLFSDPRAVVIVIVVVSAALSGSVDAVGLAPIAFVPPELKHWLHVSSGAQIYRLAKHRANSHSSFPGSRVRYHLPITQLCL